MKFIVDMNLSVKWIEFLHSFGFEAEHWSRIGDPRAKDRQILAWAHTNNSVVLSHDLDFGDLLAASGASSPSVVIIRSDATLPSDAGTAVVNAVTSHEGDLEAGALLIVEPSRFRARLLPLHD